MGERGDDQLEEILRIRGVVAENLERAIERAVEERGLSKTELASRAGVSRSMLYDVLGKKSAATTDFLTKVAYVLGLEIRELFDEE